MSIASISSRIRRAQRNSTGATLSLDDLKALGEAGILHRMALLEADEQCRAAGIEPPLWALEIGGEYLEPPAPELPRKDSDKSSLPPNRNAYSVKQLAERWSCSGELIRRMVKDGRLAKIPGFKNVRISVAEVERYESTPGKR